MILINRSKQIQEIVVTLNGVVNNPILSVHNDATRERVDIALGENVSTHQDRYDWFRVSTILFDDMESGYYNYTIGDYLSGKLFITARVKQQSISVPSKNVNTPVYTKK